MNRIALSALIIIFPQYFYDICGLLVFTNHFQYSPELFFNQAKFWCSKGKA